MNTIVSDLLRAVQLPFAQRIHAWVVDEAVLDRAMDACSRLRAALTVTTRWPAIEALRDLDGVSQLRKVVEQCRSVCERVDSSDVAFNRSSVVLRFASLRVLALNAVVAFYAVRLSGRMAHSQGQRTSLVHKASEDDVDSDALGPNGDTLLMQDLAASIVEACRDACGLTLMTTSSNNNNNSDPDAIFLLRAVAELVLHTSQYHLALHLIVQPADSHLVSSLDVLLDERLFTSVRDAFARINEANNNSETTMSNSINDDRPRKTKSVSLAELAAGDDSPARSKFHATMEENWGTRVVAASNTVGGGTAAAAAALTEILQALTVLAHVVDSTRDAHHRLSGRWASCAMSILTLSSGALSLAIAPARPAPNELFLLDAALACIDAILTWLLQHHTTSLKPLLPLIRSGLSKHLSAPVAALLTAETSRFSPSSPHADGHASNHDDRRVRQAVTIAIALHHLLPNDDKNQYPHKGETSDDATTKIHRFVILLPPACIERVNVRDLAFAAGAVACRVAPASSQQKWVYLFVSCDPHGEHRATSTRDNHTARVVNVVVQPVSVPLQSERRGGSDDVFLVRCPLVNDRTGDTAVAVLAATATTHHTTSIFDSAASPPTNPKSHAVESTALLAAGTTFIFAPKQTPPLTAEATTATRAHRHILWSKPLQTTPTALHLLSPLQAAKLGCALVPPVIGASHSGAAGSSRGGLSSVVRPAFPVDGVVAFESSAEDAIDSFAIRPRLETDDPDVRVVVAIAYDATHAQRVGADPMSALQLVVESRASHHDDDDDHARRDDASVRAVPALPLSRLADRTTSSSAVAVGNDRSHGSARQQHLQHPRHAQSPERRTGGTFLQSVRMDLSPPSSHLKLYGSPRSLQHSEGALLRSPRSGTKGPDPPSILEHPSSSSRTSPTLRSPRSSRTTPQRRTPRDGGGPAPSAAQNSQSHHASKHCVLKRMQTQLMALQSDLSVVEAQRDESMQQCTALRHENTLLQNDVVAPLQREVAILRALLAQSHSQLRKALSTIAILEADAERQEAHLRECVDGLGHLQRLDAL